MSTTIGLLLADNQGNRKNVSLKGDGYCYSHNGAIYYCALNNFGIQVTDEGWNGVDPSEYVEQAWQLPSATNIIQHITDLQNAEAYNLSSDAWDELKNHANTLVSNTYIAGPYSIARAYSGEPAYFGLEPQGAVYTAKGCIYGMPANDNDIWNTVGTYTGPFIKPWTELKEYTEQMFFDMPLFFNLLKSAAEKGIINPSTEISGLIDTEIVPVADDYSMHFDIYIDYVRDGLGYKTTDVLARWTCPAINQATPEFLEANPDYEYRADNCYIGIYGTVDKPVQIMQTKYGELQWQGAAASMRSACGMSDPANIINYLPFSGFGDLLCTIGYNIPTESGESDFCYFTVPYNMMTLDPSKLYSKNGSRGSTITIHYGKPERGVDPNVIGWNEDAYDPDWTDKRPTDNDSDYNITTVPGVNSNVGLLTDTYIVNDTTLKAIGKTLWSPSFRQAIELVNDNPIENIISVKSLPIQPNVSGATLSNIVIGNVDFGNEIQGYKLPHTFNPIKTIGTLKIPRKFSNELDWLNYNPYTTAQLFLPYIGIVDIDIQKALDRDLTLKYIFDVITGSCTAGLYLSNGLEIQKWQGNIAIDIPVTASNRAQVESQYVQGGLNTVVDLLTGNFAGAISTAMNTAITPFHSSTNGSPSPSCDAFDIQNAYLIIDTPMYDRPERFNKDFGVPLNMSRQFKNLRGFTQCDNPHIDGIPCTEAERAEIESLLREGVYL